MQTNTPSLQHVLSGNIPLVQYKNVWNHPRNLLLYLLEGQRSLYCKVLTFSSPTKTHSLWSQYQDKSYFSSLVRYMCHFWSLWLIQPIMSVPAFSARPCGPLGAHAQQPHRTSLGTPHPGYCSHSCLHLIFPTFIFLCKDFHTCHAFLLLQHPCFYNLFQVLSGKISGKHRTYTKMGTMAR